MLDELQKSWQEYSVGGINANDFAIHLSKIHFKYNDVYGSYCRQLDRDASKFRSIEDIPFLPISAFKYHRVLIDDTASTPTIFTSSGTTGSVTSKHHVYDVNHYLTNAKRIFERSYGELSEFTVLALLPSYLERSGSSLVAMVDHFITFAKEGSGFYLDDFNVLHSALTTTQGKILLIGVSFALLDFAEEYQLNTNADLVVMETGGMKGRKKEIPRAELHHTLSTAFGCDRIHSEYGMTELCSQAYSQGYGIFDENTFMKVKVRDVSDPLSNVNYGKAGTLNIIDFNNMYSCPFIETQDIGRRISDTQFEIIGRLDHSDLRGCNLLVV